MEVFFFKIDASNFTKTLIQIIFDKAYRIGEKTRSATKIEISKVPGPIFGKNINCNIRD